MSLLSLVLTVRPQARVLMPTALGRAAHAALLRAIAAREPAAAEALHVEGGARPFTCSSLRGKRANGAVLPEVNYVLRYTALTEELAARMRGLFAAGETMELDGAPFVIQRLTCDAGEHPWAMETTYERLGGRWLLARVTPAERIVLSFASPTAFRSQGKAQIFPLPELVFGSLLDKWNAFAPTALPDETRRFAAECLAVSRIQLSSRAAPFKSEGVVKFGAVGTVTYAVLNRDRYWMSLINLLADFAQLGGVGASTALGMGQCRRLTGVAAPVAGAHTGARGEGEGEG
ncbi:MAG: CRISPR-associated endoribonuclease Cas6 [Anaerolineae bacterium]|nr:CRISPR-associated endoribonuclease Cas6 [Anaerolineae bacterium]